MNTDKFREYLEERYSEKNKTVGSRLSNCKKIEEYYGDLDVIYDKDKCQSLLEELTYSAKDERAKKAPKHSIKINGRIRTGTSTLKQALNLYVKFRDSLNDKSIRVKKGLDADSHKVLLDILKSFKFDKKLHSGSRENVLTLQLDLKDFLNENYNSFTWETEYQPSTDYKDSIDLIGLSDDFNYKHIIEIDAHRADQVAKKFVSRMALCKDDNICYTAICYPCSSNKEETGKYFDYCTTIAEGLPKKKSFIGLMLGDK